MASDRQIAANKRNALKSTGPRTDAGKSRSAQNAYKHGLSSVADIGLKIVAEEIFTALRSEYSSASPALLFEIALATIETSRARKTYAEKLDGFAKAIAGHENQSNDYVSTLDKADRYVRRAQSRKTRLMRQIRLERSTKFGKTNPI